MKSEETSQKKELRTMSESPAILIFKDMSETINKLNKQERLELFDTILLYSSNQKLPKLSSRVDIVFSVLNTTFDRNEKAYKAKCEYNRKRQQEKRKKAKKEENQPTRTKPAKAEQKKQHQDEETPKKKATAEKTANKSKLEHNQDKKEFTQEQQNFINRFKDLCPEKSVDCDVNDFP